MTDSATVAAALDLAAQGIPVFPCRAVNKRPATARGFYDASTDPAEIRRMFADAEESALIGIPTGEASGLDALDLDPRHGSDAWAAQHGAGLPPTRVHTTRSGGRHFLFNHAPGLRNSAGRIGPGVDVRADGGFIIWWPAHGCEVWLDEPAAAWPVWLLGEATRRQTVARGPLADAIALAAPSVAAVVDLLDRMPNPPDVDRDTYLRVMLGAKGAADGLLAAGIDPAEAERIAAAACRWAGRWPNGPGPEAEAAKWAEDFAHRDAPLAGWRSLEAVASRLLPEYRMEQAAEEFAAAPYARLADTPEPAPTDWREMLLLTEKGTARACSANAKAAMQHAPEWRGVLGFNTFNLEVAILRRPPWVLDPAAWQPRPWTDKDATEASVWLQGAGIMVTSATAHEVAVALAKDRPFHPVRDYLRGLVWDGTPRADSWLIRHLGAADTPLHRAYSKKFLVAAVARAMRPGCQVDTVLTLEGRQGLRKSSALRVLAGGDWFTDHLPDLTSKDAAMQLQGVWVLEHAEMDKLSRAESARAKSFITTQADKFRPPYGRVSEVFPRQCVFAATINPGAGGYLTDDTGARRYWPVACGAGWPKGRTVDTAALAAERNQLWAEAAAAFHAGESWWLPADLEGEQETAAEARLDVDDSLAPVVGDIVAGQQSVRVVDILADPRLGLTARDRDKRAQMRIASALRVLGWRRGLADIEGRRAKVFFAPNVTTWHGVVRIGGA